MTSIITGKENMQTREEPVSCGDCASGGEPELRMEWEKAVTRTKICEKVSMGVSRCVELLYKYSVSLEKAVGLVGRQKERVLVWLEADCVTERKLAVIAKGFLVRENKFSQAHKRVKTR
jgi:hypothetical protein